MNKHKSSYLVCLGILLTSTVGWAGSKSFRPTCNR